MYVDVFNHTKYHVLMLLFCPSNIKYNNILYSFVCWNTFLTYNIIPLSIMFSTSTPFLTTEISLHLITHIYTQTHIRRCLWNKQNCPSISSSWLRPLQSIWLNLICIFYNLTSFLKLNSICDTLYIYIFIIMYIEMSLRINLSLYKNIHQTGC